MLFNSVDFLLFFPSVILVYFILPKKVRYIWLLLSSYYFYMKWNPKYTLLLFASTAITYIGGSCIRWIEENVGEGRKKSCKKAVLFIGLALNLGILGYFKYLNFAVNLINQALQGLHIEKSLSAIDIILPVGISFYILQALGYLIDVYRGEIYAEKNFLRYALFVSFFPQLVAGPIERSKNLLTQLAKPASFSYDNLRKGLLLMLWGYFLKLVIADRAGIIVETVYGNSSLYPGFYIVVAALLFSIQIYCDFHGYSTIARGTALIMGIRLIDNFNAPFFSQSIKELWRRWHVSLSGWFRDYLYIPLGGSRKGKVRKEINLLFVFAVSGLWHGAALSYVVWGTLNGIYQVCGELFAEIKKRLSERKKQFLERKLTYEELETAGIDTDKTRNNGGGFSGRLGRRMVTFGLFSFACVFFRADGLLDALDLFKNMRVFNWTVLFDGTLYTLGVERPYFVVMILAIVVLFAVDSYKYKGKDVADLFLAQGWCFRLFVEMLLLFTVLLFGCYGELYDTAEFIYFQF